MSSTVEFAPDTRRGNLYHMSITLSATPNTVTTIVVPASAKGFGIYSTSTIEYNINAAPAAVTGVGTTDQDAVASDEYAGAYAFGGSWAWGLLEDYNATSNASRVLQVMSATASAVLYVEFF